MRCELNMYLFYICFTPYIINIPCEQNLFNCSQIAKVETSLNFISEIILVYSLFCTLDMRYGLNELIKLMISKLSLNSEIIIMNMRCELNKYLFYCCFTSYIINILNMTYEHNLFNCSPIAKVKHLLI